MAHCKPPSYAAAIKEEKSHVIHAESIRMTYQESVRKKKIEKLLKAYTEFELIKYMNARVLLEMFEYNLDRFI